MEIVKNNIPIPKTFQEEYRLQPSLMLFSTAVDCNLLKHRYAINIGIRKLAFEKFSVRLTIINVIRIAETVPINSVFCAYSLFFRFI
jgi:hypothetical protein